MNIYEELKQNLVDEELCAVATVVSGSPDIGAKMMVCPDGRTVGGLGNTRLDAQVVPDAQSLMSLERAENRTYGETEVFIEAFAPKPKLIILGGVPTPIPLT